ncbi:MAG: hypothetical protein ACR2QJ_13090, partial [Geminicoccaceae bacterium]
QASMLELSAADLAGAAPPDRLHQAIMCWFDALSPHREVTGQMLRAKLTCPNERGEAIPDPGCVERSDFALCFFRVGEDMNEALY